MKVELITAEEKACARQIARLESEIFSDAWSVSEIESTLKQPSALCAVAEEDGVVLGYFLCYYVLDECEIARIAVRSDARRGGVGTELLRNLVFWCRQRQITRILLDVRSGNEAAITFYEKMGFVKDGIRKGYYAGEKPEDAWLMSLEIENFPV